MNRMRSFIFGNTSSTKPLRTAGPRGSRLPWESPFANGSRRSVSRSVAATLFSVISVTLMIPAPDVAQAQEPIVPASKPDADAELTWDHGLKLLAAVRDNVFSFDDPAFYWFCRWVRLHPDLHQMAVAPDSMPAGSALPPPDTPTPWKLLLERPADYRGRLIVIEGRMLQTHAYEVPNRPGVGRLYQCELGDIGTQAICTAVLIDDPGELPRATPIRVSGYFIKVRAYQTANGQAGAGPLVVARRLVVIGADDRAGAAPPSTPIPPENNWLQWTGAATALLFIIWIVTRRTINARSASGLSQLTRFPVTRTDADFDWLTDRTKPPQS